MLSDDPVKQTQKSPPRRAVNTHGVAKRWSDNQKLEAVTTYLLLGNYRLTSEKLGIPFDTLKTWAKMDWWKTAINDIRKEEKIILSKRLHGIVDSSLIVATDRLENGDWIYDQKTGELRRKPVSLRDAARVAVDAANLKQKMEVQESTSIANEQIEEKLNKLAQAFMNLSRGITNNQSVQDIEYKETEGTEDAVSEEREEGLQDGVPEVPQSS